jgi:maltooligosyltrehalose trehalohydrolase
MKTCRKLIDDLFNIPDNSLSDKQVIPPSPYSFGAFPQPDGTTHFSLWAPDAYKVAVRLADGREKELDSMGGGWYRTVVDCVAGTAYRYIIDDRIPVPDPAARLQQGKLSCVVKHHGYPWKTESWQGLAWHHTIIYELHVGLMGGFSKVEKFLPSLAQLGITAIELMPISEFPGTRNWGYDGVLPFAPESSYGTPDELKSLIDTAHSLGMMVFLDVVYNHFGPDGNYLGEYASEFFRDDIDTPWGAAIDFRKPEVRNFFCENALMWIIDYRFDGLRLDAIHTISEKDFLIELATRVRSAIDPDRHVHLILENEDNSASLLEQGFDAQWNDDGHNVLHHLLTNEDHGYYADFATSATTKLARCLSEGFVYQGEMSHTGRHRGEPSAHLPPTAFVLFLQNHDQVGTRVYGERLTQIANPDALKAATVLLLLSPMIPLLFMGEEWGVKHPFLYFTDHKTDLAIAIHEARCAHFKEFNHVMDRPIPDANAISTFLDCRIDIPPDLFSKQTEHLSDQEHWRDFYQQLLAIRHLQIIPHLPGARSAGVTIIAQGAVCAIWLLGNGSQLSIYLNLSQSAVKASPYWGKDPVLFSFRLPEQDYQQGILPAYAALVTLCKQED